MVWNLFEDLQIVNIHSLDTPAVYSIEVLIAA